jgi:hypothetical protein
MYNFFKSADEESRPSISVKCMLPKFHVAKYVQSNVQYVK